MVEVRFDMLNFILVVQFLLAHFNSVMAFSVVAHIVQSLVLTPILEFKISAFK